MTVVTLPAGQLVTSAGQAETVMNRVDCTVEVEMVGYTSTTTTLDVKRPLAVSGKEVPVEMPEKEPGALVGAAVMLGEEPSVM